MSHYCAVQSCRNSNKTTYMHRFTRKEPGYHLWLKAVGRPALYKLSKQSVCSSMYVCDIHFPESCKLSKGGKTILKMGSVPALFLDDDPLINLPTTFFLNNLQKTYRKVKEESSVESSRELAQCSAGEVIKVRPPFSSKTTLVNMEVLKEPQPSTTKSAKYPCGLGGRRRHCIFKHPLGIKLRRAIYVAKNNKLSPQTKQFHQYASNIRRTARRLHVENASNQQHLRHAIHAAYSAQTFRTRTSETSFTFLLSRFKRRRFKSRGRRFSMKDKTRALSMFKHSPEMYGFLSKMFALPSRKCLQALLDRIQIGPGINRHILEMMKKAFDRADEEEKYCALLFGEMPLSPGLHFNKTNSSIDGFAYCVEQTKLGFADRVMVFMVRGVLRRWRQPIAYFFPERVMSMPDLLRNVTTIIRSLQDIGLRVVATVCDQRANNVKTVKRIIRETIPRITLEGAEYQTRYMYIGGEEIFPLIDPPHLLNCVRNNLLKYDATFKWKGTYFTSCWLDIVKLYELDDEDCKILPKLSDCHIYESKMNKTKVELASQVFSRTLSSAMKFFVKYGNETLVTDTMMGTAEFLSFFDKLFDSVNGSSIYCDADKPLKSTISAKSEHVEFYSEAIGVLKTIKFIKPEGEFVPPCIANWITTLKGLQCIWYKLQSNGIENLYPRNLNQDPLNNLLGNISLHGNPTCGSFRGSYSALIVSNRMTIHSSNVGTPDFLKNLMHKEFLQPVIMFPAVISNMFKFKSDFNLLADSTNAYVARNLGRYLLKRLRGCNTCRCDLICGPLEDCTHSSSECGTYRKESLLKPNTAFREYVGQSIQVISFYLPKICTLSNIVLFLKTKINSSIEPAYFRCEYHDLANWIDQYLIPLYVVMWIQGINNILKGKGNIIITDDIKKLALQKYHEIIWQHLRI